MLAEEHGTSVVVVSAGYGDDGIWGVGRDALMVIMAGRRRR